MVKIPRCDDLKAMGMQALAAFQSAEKIKPDDRVVQERLRTLSKIVRARRGTTKPEAPVAIGTAANGAVRPSPLNPLAPKFCSGATMIGLRAACIAE